jgi:hypothetical protein
MTPTPFFLAGEPIRHPKLIVQASDVSPCKVLSDASLRVPLAFLSLSSNDSEPGCICARDYYLPLHSKTTPHAYFL